MKDVAEIERLAARAWPAPDRFMLDGWLLRHAAGVTRRANSVLAIDDGTALDLAARIADVERHYAKHGLPSQFQITPVSQPTHLDDELADRGDQLVAPSIVMAADLPLLVDVIGDLPAVVAPEADREWAARWWSLDRGDLMPEVLPAILTGAAGRRAYVSLGGPLPIAVGRGSVDEGWLGIFAMATDHGHRRRGHARTVLRTLSDWGLAVGATRAYLQVDGTNGGAMALYVSVGFRECYRYHYRERAAAR